MKIVDKYVYPKSSRAAIAGLRHYTLDGEEQKLPSVTTVIGQTQPKEKQESPVLNIFLNSRILCYCIACFSNIKATR